MKPIQWASRAAASVAVALLALLTLATAASACTLDGQGVAICMVQPDGTTKIYGVTWTFLLAGQGDLTIANVAVSRGKYDIEPAYTGQGAVHVFTVDQPGTTVSMTVTVTLSDGTTVTDTATKTIAADLGCGSLPTTTTTTVPPSTPPGTTEPSTTAPPTTAPSTTFTSPPPVIQPTDPPRVGGLAPVQPAPKQAVVVVAPAALPVTGSSDAVPLAAVGAGIVAAGVILVVVRRMPSRG